MYCLLSKFNCLEGPLYFSAGLPDSLRLNCQCPKHPARAQGLSAKRKFFVVDIDVVFRPAPNRVAEALTVLTGVGVADDWFLCIRIFNSCGSLVMERASMHQLMHVGVEWLALGTCALCAMTAHPNAV